MRVMYYQGDGPDRYKFVKDLAAFAVGYLLANVNVMINGEVLYEGKRIDHLGYKVHSPISLSKPYDPPVILIEDSSDEKRLMTRVTVLKDMVPYKAYILIKHSDEEYMLFTLRKAPSDLGTQKFVLEVGRQWWV